MSGARRGAALALAALMLSLSACSSAPKKEETLFAMDTVMSLTLYGDNARDALAQATDTLEQLDELWSPTQEDSQIWAVNHSGGSWTTVDGETSVLLQQSLELCQITDGALDITAYPAVEAWGFPSGDYRVPAQAELDQLASRIDYSQVELAGNRVRLPASMSLDLGAVAKGWAGELLSQQLSEAGIKSALLDLGQSIMIGKGMRSREVIDAMVRNGAVYLAAMGGAGALMSACIKSCKLICWEDLGCEAVRRLTVEDMPLTVAIDSLGGNIYESGPAAYLESLKGGK